MVQSGVLKSFIESFVHCREEKREPFRSEFRVN